MTFDLTPPLDTLLQEARRIACDVVAPASSAIDASGRIPDEVLAGAAGVVDWERSALGAVLALEELGAASGSVAASVVTGRTSESTLAGLRGVPRVASPSDRHFLGLAAVCVGMGRAALNEALACARGRGDRPSGVPDEAPHWVLADAATALEAARLLVRNVAEGDGAESALALVFAGRAASEAVDAALRIVGPEAFAAGAPLERLGRDVRAALLLLGTEDDARRRAADALLG